MNSFSMDYKYIDEKRYLFAIDAGIGENMLSFYTD